MHVVYGINRDRNRRKERVVSRWNMNRERKNYIASIRFAFYSHFVCPPLTD